MDAKRFKEIKIAYTLVPAENDLPMMTYVDSSGNFKEKKSNDSRDIIDSVLENRLTLIRNFLDSLKNVFSSEIILSINGPGSVDKSYVPEEELEAKLSSARWMEGHENMPDLPNYQCIYFNEKGRVKKGRVNFGEQVAEITFFTTRSGVANPGIVAHIKLSNNYLDKITDPEQYKQIIDASYSPENKLLNFAV